MKFWIFAVLSMFLIGIASAETITTFSNDLESETLQFFGNGSIQRDLILPANWIVSDAYINISGLAGWNISNLALQSEYTNSTVLVRRNQMQQVGELVFVGGDTGSPNDCFGIYNISDSNNIVQLGAYCNSSSLGGGHFKVDLERGVVYYGALENSALTIINISDLTNPFEQSSWVNATYFNYITDLYFEDGILYTLEYYNTPSIFNVFNVSDLNDIKVLGSIINSTISAFQFTKDDGYFYGYTMNAGFFIINATDISNPYILLYSPSILSSISLANDGVMKYEDLVLTMSINGDADLINVSGYGASVIDTFSYGSSAMHSHFGYENYFFSSDTNGNLYLVRIKDNQVEYVGGYSSGTSLTDLVFDNDRNFLFVIKQIDGKLSAYNLTEYLLNPFITANEINFWNYSGQFNDNNYKTDDFASILNSALNSGACDCNGCQLLGDNCSIPITFFTSKAGRIEYSGMNIEGYSENYTTPSIEIISPENKSYNTTIDENYAMIDFIVNLSESGTCVYSFDNGATNYTMNATLGDTYFDSTNAISNGSWAVTFYCESDFAMGNSSSVEFTIVNLITEEEEQPVEQTTGQTIREVLVSSGAGLGIFFLLLAQSLPVLLFGLMLVAILIAIGYTIVKSVFFGKSVKWSKE